MDQVINANADAIKRIDKEIKRIIDSKAVAGVTKNASDIVTENDVDKVKNKRTTKFRYFNTGYCKYCDKCRFIHPKNICTEYLNTNKCEKKECADRHPKKCKWEETAGGCRRKSECNYLHATIAKDVHTMDATIKEYKCVGCSYLWNNADSVVKHIIKGNEVFFCLNCDDWIKDKMAVFDLGWSLFDQDGFLRYDI